MTEPHTWTQDTTTDIGGICATCGAAYGNPIHCPEPWRSMLPSIVTGWETGEHEAEWQSMLDRIHRQDARPVERQYVVQWLLTHIFGTPERFQTDAYFHAQIERARQLIVAIFDA
jgi:hypothetical protein